MSRKYPGNDLEKEGLADVKDVDKSVVLPNASTHSAACLCVSICKYRCVCI